MVVFAGRSRQKAREDTLEARRIRASKLVHERGGIAKAVGALISPPAEPADYRTMAMLRSKHPIEDPAEIEIGKARAEQCAEITAVGEQEQQRNVTTEPLDAQGQIPEMDNMFGEFTVKAVIEKANPQSAADPSGLRFRHLQAAVYDKLDEDLAALATLVLSSRVWTLHTSANFSALGQKARPGAYGFRRRFLPPIWLQNSRLFPALGPARRSSFRRRSDHGAYGNNGFQRGLHHPLVRRSQCLQHRMPPQVPASAMTSANRPLSAPLHIKPVRTRTPRTPVCI